MTQAIMPMTATVVVCINMESMFFWRTRPP